MEKKSGIPPLGWFLIACAVLAVVVGGIAFAVYAVQSVRARDARHNVIVPVPNLPHPNAFDTFCQAGDALVDEAQIAAVIKSRDPREEALLVAKNQQALALLREGFTYQYLHTPVRSIDAKFPYAKWRSLARLLQADSHARAANGDWGGAANSALDSMNLGVTIPHGSPVIGALVGMVFQGIGRDQLWPTIDNLSAVQAKEVSAKLALFSTREVSSADTLQEELWFGYAGLQENFLNDDKPLPGKTEDATSAKSKKAMRQKMLDVYMDSMLKKIENSRLPYPQQKRIAEPGGPMAVAANILAPDCRKVNFKFAENATQNRLLLTAVALRAYRCEHDGYPATLQALTPTYLPSLPDDPFAPQGSFRYRRAGTSYVLYSVGPDGKDDDGSPLTNAKNATDKKGDADSRGDIVAGERR